MVGGPNQNEAIVGELKDAAKEFLHSYSSVPWITNQLFMGIL